MALNQVSVVPVGVLRVFSGGFLTPTRSFSKGAPHHFPKAHALRYGHRKFGDDQMYIRGPWALRRLAFRNHMPSAVPAGVLRVISYVILTYTRYISNREPIPFSTAHALSYTHSKVGNDQMHIRGEMTSGKFNFKRVCKKPTRVLMVIWSTLFLAHTRTFSNRGNPSPFSDSTCPEV